MNLSQERSGDYLVVEINEPRVDSTNFAILESSLCEIIEGGEKNLIINLSQVSFMDSSGIAGLLPSVKSLAEDGNLFLVGLSSKVLQLFNLGKLDTIFNIYPSVEEVLQN